jgi:hypothetical protein
MFDLKRFTKMAMPTTALVGALMLIGTLPAQAADPTEVEDLIREGIALRRSGNDSRALPLFQKAHALAHTPRTAAQLGLVEFALGYAIEAENHLSQGLAAPTDPWIAKNQGVLEDGLARVRARIGEVAVTGSPDGAEVILNGRSVGRLPLAAPIRVGQGPATVDVRSTGYASASSSVDVAGGKTQKLVFHLEAVTPAASPKLLAVDLAAKQPDAAHVGEASPSAGGGPGARTIVGWSLVGIGGVGAAVGAVWLLSADGGCTAMPGFECTRGPTNRTPGWVLLAGGAASGIVGGVVLLTRPAAQFEVALTPAAFVLRGRL